MLTEETLIVLGALGALGLVVLGTLQLVWPARRKDSASARRWRSHHPRHAAGGPDRYLKRPEGPEPQQRAEPASAAPIAPPVAPIAPPVAPITPPVAPIAPPPTAPVTPVTPMGPPPVAAPAVSSAGPSASAIVERCAQLYQARRYTETVATATAALTASRRPDGAGVAALWSLLGFAQRALGDPDAARAAMEAAIDSAPADTRATYERQLVTLTLGVARNLIGAAGAHATPHADRRVNDLRDALEWLERGRTLAPDDAELRDLTMTAEARLWPAYEQVVMALVQRQEFRAARRLLHEALEDPRVPAGRAATFRELVSGTFSGEIGQLTAQAIRSMQEARETEAQIALERAEQLLETVHDEALPPKRREEVDRRLWWGYNRLGRRRVEAGAFEDAMEPLLRALRLAGPAPDRQAETRAMLVQAFEGWTETCALAIREVAAAGDHEAAIVGSDKLWKRLRDAVDEGLSERELAGAFARVRRLFEEIGRRP